ncbi:INO80 chromatin remodeling complex [Rasamsonia emersonii CBS 393.64]|uniref:INO80 chromatin remodeling complex n=1 Tax=Rasamsonia emersonii (strain ATCC 16479 / CBS 393.64 / IMI 116815) TaxID=1408163 RepID=A0A0F4YU21_RASE3|nr:INO80 chromatin remodeling complex [Rasamsonia emersonii CBS 393.64]KKA21346.1 INO80 chromatin remodeling complex [Rasamsonia emersonii CBS 393.64]
MAEVESSTVDDSFAHSEAPEEQPTHSTVSATVGTRRQANGTIGSVYSGNKIKHLKKEDGIPLWRKDIQYQFLKLVFEDKTPVFTRYPDGKKGCDFADIYIDAMARSSKTSKILKDKLQSDKQAAINMAMVCLLVNFGRMNTTLNFFPEMRAQLRTYHSIPSLQAHQDPNAYKQLQDAPRLKSILKGASEDVDQPNTIEKIMEMPVPRTNPVHLIFVLAQFAPKISEMHFFPPRDFFDLVMRHTLSSRSRARAFLWLMWWYLESDFTREAALNNPFGPGLDGEGTGGLPIKVPPFESLTEEQANEENVDTPEEIRYGEEKRLERKRILEEDEPLPRVTKRSKKDYGYDDDMVSGDFASGKLALFPTILSSQLSNATAGRGDRLSLGGRGSAASTPMHASGRRLDEDEDWATPGSGRGRYKRVKGDSSVSRTAAQQRLILKTKMDQTPDAASPAPPGSGHPILNQFVTDPAIPSQNPPARRPRPLTQHQLAVEQNRRQRIEYLLAQRKNETYRVLREQRQSEIPVVRYKRMLEKLPDDYDTDDENSWGKGGLIPNPEEQEDFGEAAHYFLSVVRKAARRLDRWDWENANGPKKDRQKAREERRKAYRSGAPIIGLGAARATPKVSRATKPESSATDAAAASTKTDVEPSSPMPADDVEGDETLDDIDKELLGEMSGNEEAEDEDATQLEGVSGVPESDIHGENGYDESFVAEGGAGDGEEEEAEGLSSDNDEEHDDEADDEELDEAEGDGDVEGEGGDNSSTFEGGNGYAASDSSSEAGGDHDVDVEDGVEGEVDNEVDEDEAMEDQEE